MSEKVTKKKGKGKIIFLIIVVVVALVAFGYVKYLDGTFNSILKKFEFSKDLVVQDLDFDDTQENDEHIEEVVLGENCSAKYLLDDNNLVQVAHVKKTVSSETFAMPILEVVKTASKTLKGIDLDFETDADGMIEFNIRFAPGDIDDSVFEKVEEIGIFSKEEIDVVKTYLENPTVENISELINWAF